MLDFILDIVLWMVVIWLIMKVWEKYLIIKNEELAKQVEDMTRQIKEQIIHVNIEKYGEMYYLFEKDTNRFIAQGTNFEEVQKHCVTRFKDKSVITDESQMEQFGIK
jgi:hypothetical protein